MMAVEGQKDGMSISLVQQPPKSPDFNILDLGFFNAIQSLQMRENIRSIDELIDVVERSFSELDHASLTNSFLTLQFLELC